LYHHRKYTFDVTWTVERSRNSDVDILKVDFVLWLCLLF